MKLAFIPLYILLLSPFASQAQATSVNGNIKMPSLIDLDVTYPNNLQIGFEDLAEFAKGKEYKNCINIVVKSNCPWVVSVKSGNNSFIPKSGTSSTVPSNIISLKPSTGVQYVPVTNAPAPLIVSDNDNITNQYNLDLKMATPWNAQGGQYGMNLIFSISAQ